jgi:hypothetical protein
MENVSVEIEDIVSRVSASDAAELSRAQVQAIVASVLEAVRAERAHDERRRAEQEPLGNFSDRSRRR